jgi:hypothetical protein
VRKGGEECTRVFTAVAPEITRHPRTQWVTAYTALSPEIGRCCLRRRRNVHRLDASLEASGPHGFAVRKLQALSSEAPLASTASRPALVTIAIRPFRWDETVIDMHPISISEKAEYFSLWVKANGCFRSLKPIAHQHHPLPQSPLFT